MSTKHAEHHESSQFSSIIREIVFGLEDGMVSTLGAITGIATGTNNHFVVTLSGLVIIAVESISMAVGSYLSSKSEKEIAERKLREEKKEIVEFPREEKIELIEIYEQARWSKKLAQAMADEATQDKKKLLREMAFHELKVFPDNLENPLKNGITMGISYIFGGAIPLLPYLLSANISSAILFSVVVTLCGLFLLGVMTTKFTKRKWWQAGLEMLLLASAAALVGYFIGKLADLWLLKA